MACRGVHFAITSEQADKLLRAKTDDELFEIVAEEIEEAWEEEHLAETDKAWDGLHRCLSDGSMDPTKGQPPLNKCFFGGRLLNRKPDYYVVLLSPAEVQDVATALAGVTEAWLKDRYFNRPFLDCPWQKTPQDWEYSWGWFQGLPKFFARAASEGRHVIFTVDQ